MRLTVELFMAGYSKEEELEADRDGATLAVENGYSYTGIIDLFHEFEKREKDGNRIGGRSDGPLSEAAQLSVSTLSGYFASHPPSQQRAERIRELALERGWGAKPLRRLAQGDETFNSTSNPSWSDPRDSNKTANKSRRSLVPDDPQRLSLSQTMPNFA